VAGGGLDVARATVRVLAAGAPVSCPWDAAQRRHSCRGLPSWMYVAEEALVVDGRRERCVWAHPRTGAALTIDFDDVSAPHGLRLQAALSDQAAQTPGGAPVTYVLTRADARAGAPMAQELARVTVHARRGFTDGVTGPLERGQLRLTVTTTNDRQRHTCFRLTPLAAPGVSQAAP
jgi:hypothetical protein